MNKLGYQHLKGKFNYCQDVSWDDVIDKIDNEYKNLSYKVMVEERRAPTFVLHNFYLPGTLGQVFNKVNEDMKTKILHVYASLGQNSPTFGRHKDIMDVLLIQSIGSVKYRIDNDSSEFDTLTLNPGDGVIIREGVYHTPIIEEPRVTLSFSWR